MSISSRGGPYAFFIYVLLILQALFMISVFVEYIVLLTRYIWNSSDWFIIIMHTDMIRMFYVFLPLFYTSFIDDKGSAIICCIALGIFVLIIDGLFHLVIYLLKILIPLSNPTPISSFDQTSLLVYTGIALGYAFFSIIIIVIFEFLVGMPRIIGQTSTNIGSSIEEEEDESVHNPVDLLKKKKTK